MFNYIGTIERIGYVEDSSQSDNKSEAARKKYKLYGVRIPQISTNELIECRVLTIPGLYAEYALKDSVVIAELEGNSVGYVIIGKLEKESRDEEFNAAAGKLSVTVQELQVQQAGKLPQSVILEKSAETEASSMTIAKLLAEIDSLKHEVETMRTWKSTFSGLLS